MFAFKSSTCSWLKKANHWLIAMGYCYGQICLVFINEPYCPLMGFIWHWAKVNLCKCNCNLLLYLTSGLNAIVLPIRITISWHLFTVHRIRLSALMLSNQLTFYKCIVYVKQPLRMSLDYYITYCFTVSSMVKCASGLWQKIEQEVRTLWIALCLGSYNGTDVYGNMLFHVFV